MRILERLARLDRAVLPPHRRYDRHVPLWITFASFVGVGLGLTAVQTFVHTSGHLRAGCLTAELALFGAYLLLALRWERQHRRRERWDRGPDRSLRCARGDRAAASAVPQRVVAAG